MVWFDFVVIVVIVVSAIISVIRGFVREALSLLAWVLAIVASLKFTAQLSPWMAHKVGSDSGGAMLAFISIFAGVLVIVSIANVFIVKMLHKTALRSADRSLGALFGLVRGGLVVMVAVIILELTPAPKANWWKQSLLLPYFKYFSHYVRTWVPKEVANRFDR